MNRESGFGTVEFLALMPLLLSVLATIAGASLLFKANSHLRHECRVSVLNSQRTVAEKLRALIKMNPRAQALRAEAAAAQAELEASAAIPGALPAAEANLLRVRLERIAFAAAQQALIQQARGLSFAAPLRARSAVMEGLVKETHENKVATPPVRSSSRPGRFSVIATPEGDLTPDYNPSPTFVKDQVVDVDVTVEVGSLLPDWLRKLLPTGGLEISSHCQATIEKQEETWIETLNAVR